MSNGFLSQEEIDSLLNGGFKAEEEPPKNNEEELLSEIERDLLGEIGNISMGSASTALSQVLNQPVNITTPVVTLTTLKELKVGFEVPNIALEVEYITGIVGINLLVVKTTDASVIANLMMGGNGEVETPNLSELEISAVSEAMNQMIGSAATSMATMFAREVNISPPISKIWDDTNASLSDKINEEETIVKVSFRLTIGTLIDSSIMQLLPISTAKKIVAIMMGNEEPEKKVEIKPQPKVETHYENHEVSNGYDHSGVTRDIHEKSIDRGYNEPRVPVQEAHFKPLSEATMTTNPKNIDLILDVPLEVSVVLGKTKKSIKEILNLGTGSLIELDKLAEEPVEILVNGKMVAFGEVVVVDENFGVRITSIVSSSERVKSLSK